MKRTLKWVREWHELLGVLALCVMIVIGGVFEISGWWYAILTLFITFRLFALERIRD